MTRKGITGTLRENICDVVSNNADHFSQFLDCAPDKFLQDLSRPGAYAGNEAISAFSKAHGVDVFIHQLKHQDILRISPYENTKLGGRGQIHLAYDSENQHYYSVKAADFCNEPPDIGQLMKEHGVTVVDI